MKKIQIKRMVESAILLALAYILSIIKLHIIPNGGSITLVSMLPIILLAYRYGPLWGALCGGIHGLLQMLEGGLYPPPVATITNYILVILLDYILAWAMVGLLSGLVMGLVKVPRWSVATGAVVGIGGRFLCNFLSGVIIWSTYAPKGQAPIVYSFLTNGLVLLPEALFTAIVAFGLLSYTPIKNLFTVPVNQE